MNTSRAFVSRKHYALYQLHGIEWSFLPALFTLAPHHNGSKLHRYPGYTPICETPIPKSVASMAIVTS